MFQYTVRRLLLFIPTLFVVAVLIFFVMRVIPGDVAILILGGDIGVVDPADMLRIRELLGLEAPRFIKTDFDWPFFHPSQGSQFGSWLEGLIRFDLGDALYTGEKVSTEIARKLPLTTEIALLGTLAAVTIAIPVGAITAIYQDKWPDYIARLIAITGLAAPSFWIGILILLGLIFFFNWSPPLGYISVFDRPWENFQIIIFPAITVSLFLTAFGIRMMRASMLEVMRQDYVTTARAKGLKERVVIVRHALKNAIIPVVTLMGMQFAFLFGGLITTETVFSVPGLGRFLVQSVTRRDYPLVQGIVLTMAFIIMFMNLVVDLSYGWLDPRIRYQ